jgi:hypothetical protein
MYWNTKPRRSCRSFCNCHLQRHVPKLMDVFLQILLATAPPPPNQSTTYFLLCSTCSALNFGVCNELIVTIRLVNTASGECHIRAAVQDAYASLQQISVGTELETDTYINSNVCLCTVATFWYSCNENFQRFGYIHYVCLSAHKNSRNADRIFFTKIDTLEY